MDRIKNLVGSDSAKTQSVMRLEPAVLRAAVAATFDKRGTNRSPENARLVLREIMDNGHMKEMWLRYQAKSDYAQGIAWETTVGAVSRLEGMVEGA